MVKILGEWQDKRTQILDQAAPILETLKGILTGFEVPEAGYFGKNAFYIRLSSKALVLEQPTIELLLLAAKAHDAVLSIDTKQGPLVVTIMKHGNIF